MVFHSDLDNTMIYSYKHDIGNEKRCVEIYQGREISYVTDRTHELLRQVQDRVLFVPTTTRTTEQYRRIDLGIGPVRYALTCNGGVLLVDGQRMRPGIWSPWCRSEKAGMSLRERRGFWRRIRGEALRFVISEGCFSLQKLNSRWNLWRYCVKG